MPQPSLPSDLYQRLTDHLASLGLMIYGALHPGRVPCPDLQDGTLILIGTALDELERSGGKYGLVTMCAAGGRAPAIIIERLDG